MLFRQRFYLHSSNRQNSQVHRQVPDYRKDVCCKLRKNVITRSSGNGRKMTQKQNWFVWILVNISVNIDSLSLN